MFQSTHPHGVRLSRTDIDENPVRFNPRTHTGCDNLEKEWMEYPILRFNPRTHTGCDDIMEQIVQFSEDREFQSTHPHGVRRVRLATCIICEWSFNPRTHTGCDSVQSYIL